MPPFILSALANPIRTLTIAGYIVAGLAVGGLLINKVILEHQVSNRDAKIATMTIEHDALKQSIDSMNLEIDRAKASRAALEESIHKQQDRSNKAAEVEKEIRNAPSSDDAPVAPVLRRAIERLQQH